MEAKKTQLLAQLKTYIKEEDTYQLTQFLDELYPADIAELMWELDDDEVKVVIPCLPLEKIAFSIQELDFSSRRLLLKFLEPEQLKVIINNMYADDLVDLLGSISIGQSKQLLNLMRRGEARQIQNLLGYDEESAGGIMTTEYIAIRQNLTAEQALKKIREVASEAEMIYYIYLVDEKQTLVGVLSMRELITAEPESQLKKVMHQQIISAQVGEDQEEVAQLIAKYDLLSIPVVNNRGQLLGIITVDDIIDVIEAETTEDIYKLAGTTEIEAGRNLPDILSEVVKRIPWLFVLLFTSLLSGSVIQNFEQMLESVVALSFFIPVLMGTGGNAGTQSLTVVVRGLALGEINNRELGRAILDEIKVGLFLGFVCGLIITLIALLWQGDYILGLVVGGAMFWTVLIAALLGTLIPLVINYFGADPAVAAGPFITTLIDVSGLFIYFSLATLALDVLG
jgi:magnesium transporter